MPRKISLKQQLINQIAEKQQEATDARCRSSENKLLAEEWQKVLYFALKRLGGRLVVGADETLPAGRVTIKQQPNGDTVFLLIVQDAATGLPIIGGERGPVIIKQ